MKKSVKKKSQKSYRYAGVFSGLLGYFLFVLLVNLASKGLSKSLLFNPYDAALFLGEQISVIVFLPVPVALTLGFILSFIPFGFFYTLLRDLTKELH